MELEKQITSAEQVIKTLYGETLPLFPRPASPLHFPDGMRIPYSLYYVSDSGSFRMRESMLVLFFKNADLHNGQCTVEWNELQAPGTHDRVEKLQSFHDNGVIHFLPISEVYPSLLAKNSEVQQVESLEITLDDSTASMDNAWQTCWRVGVWLTNGKYKVEKIGARIVAGLPPNNPIVALNFNPPDDVSLSNLKARQDVEKTALDCRYKVSKFFSELGYRRLDMRDILVQCNLAQGETCHTEHIEHLSVITLNESGDVDSIVLHEFAHALWYLFYVRPPESLVTETGDEDAATITLREIWKQGIEEGFADYFAGAVDGESDTFPIGRGNWRRRGKLRTITGNYIRPAAQTDEAHVVGEQWANALWNLRRYMRNRGVTQKEIDQLILYAHFKPPKLSDAANYTGPFTDPFKCYYESLQMTAQNMNLAGHFAEWPLGIEFV